MSKSLTASKHVMHNYLSELLTEDKPVKEKSADRKLEKLLQKIPSVEKPQTAQREALKAPLTSTPRPSLPVEEVPIITAKSKGKIEVSAPKSYRQGSFQAMFFKVAGLTIAVPLIELGGIHNTDKTTPLMGKPTWFKGVMVHRDEKINIVDTAQWVMPEKCDKTLKDSLNYQYVIMLSDSAWGVLAEELVDTVTLQQDDVKWLDNPSKRPWLAGLVKERKCALLDVNSMIQLLSEGASISNTE